HIFDVRLQRLDQDVVVGAGQEHHGRRGGIVAQHLHHFAGSFFREGGVEQNPIGHLLLVPGQDLFVVRRLYHLEGRGGEVGEPATPGSPAPVVAADYQDTRHTSEGGV